MKYFFITDDIGNPYYYDHPDGYMIGMPLSTSLSVASEKFGETWQSIRCSKLRLVFAQKSFMSFLAVSDEQEEDLFLLWQIHFIQDLFYLLHGPNVYEDKGTARAITKPRAKKFYRSLFNTVKDLCTTKQCFLLSSIERLEVIDEHRGIVVAAVKKVLKDLGFPQIIHVLVLVGTEVLLNYTRPKTEPLATQDLLMLITLTRSHFRPLEQEVKVSEIPVADYTDHSNLSSSFSYATGVEPPSAVGDPTAAIEVAASAPVPRAHGVVEAESTSGDNRAARKGGKKRDGERMGASSSSTATPPVGSSGRDISDVEFMSCDDDDSDYRWRSESSEKEGNAPHLLVGSLSQVDSNHQFFTPPHDPVKQLHLHDGSKSEPALKKPRRRATGVIDESSSTDSLDAIRAMAAGGAGEGSDDDLMLGGSMGALSLDGDLDMDGDDTETDAETVVLSARDTEGTGESGTEGGEAEEEEENAEQEEDSGMEDKHRRRTGSSFIPPASKPMFFDGHEAAAADEEEDEEDRGMFGDSSEEYEDDDGYVTKEPLHRLVYLKGHSTAVRFHAYDISAPITLLVNTRQGTQAPEREREQLNLIKAALKDELRSFLQFFITKHGMGMVPNMLSYIHQLPGLVHYIFVDRSSGRVTAPNITQLSGQEFVGTKEYSRCTLEVLKSKVWDMVQKAHVALSSGYSQMLMTCGDFQYSYQLWFESDKTYEQPTDPLDKGMPASRKGMPITNEFYADLCRRLFPSKYRSVKCYELYTLYLSGVSAKTIATHNSTLIDAILRSQ